MSREPNATVTPEQLRDAIREALASFRAELVEEVRSEVARFPTTVGVTAGAEVSVAIQNGVFERVKQDFEKVEKNVAWLSMAMAALFACAIAFAGYSVWRVQAQLVAELESMRRTASDLRDRVGDVPQLEAQVASVSDQLDRVAFAVSGLGGNLAVAASDLENTLIQLASRLGTTPPKAGRESLAKKISELEQGLDQARAAVGAVDASMNPDSVHARLEAVSRKAIDLREAVSAELENFGAGDADAVIAETTTRGKLRAIEGSAVSLAAQLDESLRGARTASVKVDGRDVTGLREVVATAAQQSAALAVSVNRANRALALPARPGQPVVGFDKEIERLVAKVEQVRAQLDAVDTGGLAALANVSALVGSSSKEGTVAAMLTGAAKALQPLSGPNAALATHFVEALVVQIVESGRPVDERSPAPREVP